jgi:hypothetical protein
MKMPTKTMTWRISNILLISLLMTHCNACKDEEQDELLVEQQNLLVEHQKLIAEFRKNYVELASASEFDKTILNIMEKDIADINIDIEELKAYKTIAEAAKRAESIKDLKERQGYLARIREVINNNKGLLISVAGRGLGAFISYLMGSRVPLVISFPEIKDLKGQIVGLTKTGLQDKYKFKPKLATLDDVINGIGSMIAILENILKIRQENRLPS